MKNPDKSFWHYLIKMSYNLSEYPFRENRGEVETIRELINKINKIKQNDPDIDIFKIINEQFGEESGKKFSQAYSICSKIIDDGIYTLKQSVENFRKNIIDRIDGYSKKASVIIKALESPRMKEILEKFKSGYYELERILCSPTLLNQRRFDELITLNKKRYVLSETAKNLKRDIDYKIKCYIIDDPRLEQFNELCEQFADEERILMTALLLAKNRGFFVNYRRYMLDIGCDIDKKYQEFLHKISSIEIKLQVIRNNRIRNDETESDESESDESEDDEIRNNRIRNDEIEDDEIEDDEKIKKIEMMKKVSKFIHIKPNVFIKYLPKAEDNVYSIREDCCLEFDLKYDEKINKTTLTMFFDTYDVVSGGRFKHFSERYKCDNIKRYKLGEYSYQGKQSINFVTEMSVDVKQDIEQLNYLMNEKTSKLLNILKNKRVMNLICKNQNFSSKFSSDESNILDCPLNDDDIKNRIFEKGILTRVVESGWYSNKIDIESLYFEGFDDDNGKESFRIANNNIQFRKPIEEYKNKLDSGKLNEVDKSSLIDKVKNSSELTNEDKSILIDKLMSNSELNENDKLFLMNKIKSDISDKINEISKDKIILDAFTPDMLYKIEKLDLSKLNITTKLALIEKIDSNKLGEAYKQNIIDIIENSWELNTWLSKEMKLNLINKIKSDQLNDMKLLRAIRGRNKQEEDLLNTLSYFYIKSKKIAFKLKFDIFNNTLRKSLEALENPQNQECNPTSIFKEVFGDTLEKHQEGIVVLSKRPRIQCITGDMEREKDILNAVMTFHTIEKTMENIEARDKLIVKARNAKEDEQYIACDGVLVEDLRLAKILKEVEEMFPTGLRALTLL